MKIIHKSYKFRINPNEEQQVLLSKHFGATRFVFNHYLNKRKETYLENKTSLNYYDNANDLTVMKKDDNYILELCIERTIPGDQLPGQIHDWYEDNLHMFFIRDVYEPLSLLVEWMQEKYVAELVQYYRGGTGTGIFKTEADEDYLDSEVSSVRLKFIWKK
jgi:hypothetical protein